jgi:hypothetical protein
MSADTTKMSADTTKKADTSAKKEFKCFWQAIEGLPDGGPFCCHYPPDHPFLTALTD